MTSSTPPPRRLPGTNIWALLVVAVLVLGGVVWQQRASGPQPTVDGSVSALGRLPTEQDSSGLSAALSDMQEAWRERNRDAFIAAAGESSASKSWSAQTYDNLDELGVKTFDPQLVDEGLTADQQDGTFRAMVDLTWVPGAGSGLPSRRTDAATVSLTVRPSEDGFGIESAAPTDDPMPLWLEGALDVTRLGNRVVVRVDGGSEVPRLEQMLGRAMADVRRVYGKPRSDAFVVIPREDSQSTDIVGGSPQRLSQIAAITTTLDGSDSSSAPVAVVLNPDVFTPMDARAAQIVLTHEAAHDVTGATTEVAPLWVAEGYADYVALSRDRLDPTRSASQILKRVRDGGPPEALPVDEEFGSASPRLGATYESAWMVFRMLGETYDDSTIAEFYRRVLAGQAPEVVAPDVFDLELGQITAQWRQYLADWARIAHPA
ncbi:MAG: hypothetical protein ACRDO7_04060 [Nocardioidaceae bacterium]